MLEEYSIVNCQEVISQISESRIKDVEILELVNEIQHRMKYLQLNRIIDKNTSGRNYWNVFNETLKALRVLSIIVLTG